MGSGLFQNSTLLFFGSSESVGEDCQGLGHIVYESTNSKVITDYQEEIARLE